MNNTFFILKGSFASRITVSITLLLTVPIVTASPAAGEREGEPHEAGQHHGRDDERHVGDDQRNVRDTESPAGPARIKVPELKL